MYGHAYRLTTYATWFKETLTVESGSTNNITRTNIGNGKND
jgi:hypothetical protein